MVFGETVIGKSWFEFHLLGLPRMTWSGETFALARRQARALLYYLANASTPVPRDKLLFLFWPDVPEAKARRNLTRLASYVRQELPHPEILLVTRDGLQANPERVRVDVGQFSRLCAEATTHEQAVSMYRGQFLMGFSLGRSPEFDLWLTAEQGRYEALYLETLADLVRRKDEQGEHLAAIEYAQRYLAVDELAEEMHRQLIGLYAADGNRTAALRQYETCVQVLERELGVSPLPETSLAYESALKGVSASTRPSIEPVWDVLPSLHLPRVGQEAAWEALQTSYQRARSGGVILISGEAGIGKSRLLGEFASQGERTVLAGSNYPSTQNLPYHALVGAIRQALPHPHLWIGIAPIWLGELAQLLPELRDYFPDLPQPLELEPSQAQARLYEALTRTFFGLAAQGYPLLLCLDDLHWADEGTLSWLSAIPSRLAGSRLCILGTYRQEKGKSLLNLQRALRRGGLLAEVALGGLSSQAIDEILRQVPGEIPNHTLLASRLQRATGGNTFFVLETVRALLENDQLDAPPETLPLPVTVQETILSRLGRLTPLARQILDAACVLSPDLELPLLWHTAGRTEIEVADGLDELVRHHILQERDDQLEFRHELLRITAYLELNPWRRKLLHRRAGDALGITHAANQDAVAAQMAAHYDAAQAYEQAVEAYQRAVAAAQVVYAHEEAIRQLRRAIALVPEIQPEPELPARLYEALGVNLANAGRFEEARAAYREALVEVSAGSPVILARLHWRLAKTHLTQLYYDKVELHLEQALTALGQPSPLGQRDWWRLWLDIQMDRLTLFAYLFDTERFDALSQEIAPVMVKIGTLEQQIDYQSELFIIDLVKNGYRPSPGTFALVDTQLELAYASQNPWKVTFAQFSCGYCLLHGDDLGEAEKWILKSLERTRQFDFRVHEARCLAFLSTLYRLWGDVERTAFYAQLAGEKGAAVGSRHYVAHSLTNTAWLAYCAGENDLALESARKAFKDFLDTKVPFAWLAGIILLAIYQANRDFAQAMAVAETMLDPMQQRLPDELVATLEGARDAWASQELEETAACIEKAVELARGIGYL